MSSDNRDLGLYDGDGCYDDGWHADSAEDSADLHAPRYHSERFYQEPESVAWITCYALWETRTGEQTQPVCMSDEHLLNTCRFLTRKITAHTATIPITRNPINAAWCEHVETTVRRLNRWRQVMRTELASRHDAVAWPQQIKLAQLVTTFGELECLAEQMLGEEYEAWFDVHTGCAPECEQ